MEMISSPNQKIISKLTSCSNFFLLDVPEKIKCFASDFLSSKCLFHLQPGFLKVSLMDFNRTYSLLNVIEL